MILDTTKETLCMNQLISTKTDILFIEGDVIVPDCKPDILNNICTNGNMCITRKEVLDGKIKLEGKLCVYTIYLADDEKSSIRSLNTFLEFSENIEIEKCKPNMKLEEEIRIKSIETKILNGRKMNIKAVIEVETKIYSNANIDIITKINDMENLQMLKKDIEINSLTGEGTSKTFLKETINVDNIDNIVEILNVDFKIINKDLKISYNKVLAKADAQVKIMYLTEDDRICTINSTMAVMGFVDIHDVDETDICDMQYRLKDLKINLNNIEEHSMYIEAEIELNCNVYKTRQIELIQDLYNPNQSVEFTQTSVQTSIVTESFKQSFSYNNKTKLSDFETNKLYDAVTSCNITNKKIQNNKIIIEGDLYFEFIYSSINMTGIETQNVKMPFAYEINKENIQVSNSVEISLDISNDSFLVLQSGDIDINLDMSFNVKASKNINLNIIDEIKSLESRDKENYSMVIYFTKKGDTLWDIAKKFGSTMNDIARVNDIENENMIKVGMQLFIPKYIKRYIA